MKRFAAAFIFAAITVLQFDCSKDESIAESSRVSETDTTFSDVDGNTYRATKFGIRYWMVENFRAAKTADGQYLQGVHVYADSNNTAAVYGRLYTWPAAVQAAPRGWRLPTKEEWEELINSLGGVSVAGGKLKEDGTTHWNIPNTGATNSLGFSALPGGFRGPDGAYYELGKHGDYWGTAINGQEPYCVYLYHTSASISMEVSPIDKSSGIAFSVRYVAR